jgi:hypothetical protein
MMMLDDSVFHLVFNNIVADDNETPGDSASSVRRATVSLLTRSAKFSVKVFAT